MISAPIDPLETMIREAGESWLIDAFAPSHDAMTHLRSIIQRADAAAQQRLGADAPRLTPQSLIQMFSRNPHKVRAFLQVAGTVASPEILLMVWRILQGMAVVAVRMEYDANGDFHLHIRLASSGEKSAPEDYESSDINDAVILRHLGILKIEGRGSFDGFYALNRR
jgi:hypothetical protein